MEGDRARADTVDLSDETNEPQFIVEISDATSEKDLVRFSVRTKTFGNLDGFDSQEVTVRRRHEEFIWLHSSYVESDIYAAFIIPPSPPKPDFESQRQKLMKLASSESSMTKDEMAKFKHELEAEYLSVFKRTVATHEMFLTRLSKHPVFSRDQNLRIFLTFQDDLTVRGKNSKEKIGGWFSSIGKHADELILNSQKDRSEFFTAERTLITSYYNQVKEATSKSDKANTSRKALANSLINVAASMSALATLEGNVQLEKFLALTTDGMEKLRLIENRVSSDEDLKLSDLLRYYTRDSEAARSLLYRRLRCLSNLEAANKNLEKARQKNKEISLAEEAQKRAYDKYTKIEEGAKDELEDFKKRKLQNYKRSLTELAVLEVKHCEEQINILRENIASLKHNKVTD